MRKQWSARVHACASNAGRKEAICISANGGHGPTRTTQKREGRIRRRSHISPPRFFRELWANYYLMKTRFSPAPFRVMCASAVSLPFIRLESGAASRYIVARKWISADSSAAVILSSSVEMVFAFGRDCLGVVFLSSPPFAAVGTHICQPPEYHPRPATNAAAAVASAAAAAGAKS